MAKQTTSDEVARQFRDQHRKQIAGSSSAAAEKLLQSLPKTVKKQELDVEAIAGLIAKEIQAGLNLQV